MLLDALNEYTNTYPSHWKSVVNWVPVYSIYWHLILLCPIIYVCANSTICHSSIFSYFASLLDDRWTPAVNWSRRPHPTPSPESKQGLLRQSVNIRGHSLLYESSGFKVVQFQGNGTASEYDDVIKWKHFPRYWPFARGIHRSPVNSPQRPVTRNFDDFFDLRLNKRLRKQSWGWWFETPSRPLWRHCNDLFKNRNLSQWQLCRPLRQCRFSLWQHTVSPVMTKLASWQLSAFGVKLPLNLILLIFFAPVLSILVEMSMVTCCVWSDCQIRLHKSVWENSHKFVRLIPPVTTVHHLATLHNHRESLRAWAQPMRYDIILLSRLSLAEPISRITPEPEALLIDSIPTTDW